MTAPLTHRLIPPASAAQITVHGRKYDPANGAIDAYEHDALRLQANGWILIAPSGPTSQRPDSPVGNYPRVPGTKFWDTTISHLVVWNGKNWIKEDGTVG
ncbi:hypothetical protein ACRQ5Q_15075 [Bradyrhizobium sp. PMVTL-01]|uniref:hypothetical protein n=1 Tax=Bradyrhizobium sp. PMVTL-01 TaxID=3434999 RepID=UPI003F705B22